jgi:ankyrin repeat protein
MDGGLTPLYIATFEGHMEVVQELLAWGANMMVHLINGWKK